MRGFRAVVLTACAALAAVLVTGGVAADASWDAVRDHSAPRVTSATGLYFALNDMDAQIANQLLAGDTASLARTRADAARVYERRRVEAAGYLRDLAAAAAGDPAGEREVAGAIADFGAYEELAARALALGRTAEYRNASHLMRTRLLPEADALVTANDRAFEHTYRDALGRAAWARAALIGTGLALLAVLVALQIHLAGRFRRVVNPGAVAATLLVLAVTVVGAAGIGTQRHDLEVARRDAFDSVLALTRARAVAYDANADESRYLLDRAHSGAQEAAFLGKSQRLLRVPGATIDTYATGLDDVRVADGATGYFGDEFRNITFPGERAAAGRVLARYRAYQRDDRTVRTLARAGRHTEAVAYCTGYGPGESNHDFAALDAALRDVIAINMSAYERASADGARGALPQPLGLAGGVAAAAALVLLGLRPRLAEFR
ncbi:hypothetical protein ACIP98_10825 [Streptomyces sp. NPDC088354]|uniref:hypothetical protein n=1 Tax=Streptomyces sp. NPDC088354 TaxID=3365856 RepID=UPI00382AEBC1